MPPAGWEIALTWILVRAPGYLTVSWLTRKPSWPGFKGFISRFRMDPRGNTNTPILEVFGRLYLQCNVRGKEGFGGFVVFGRATVLDWRIREFQTYWSMRGRYVTILGVSITLTDDFVCFPKAGDVAKRGWLFGGQIEAGTLRNASTFTMRPGALRLSIYSG